MQNQLVQQINHPVHSLKSVWQRKFISKLIPEDCCHLNGLCMEEGELKYVSMFAAIEAPQGWRSMPFDSVWSVTDQEAVCTGLVQPHSPRLHNGYVPNFPLHDRLKTLHMPDRCQLIAVNLKTGQVIQPITFEGAAREFFRHSCNSRLPARRGHES